MVSSKIVLILSEAKYKRANTFAAMFEIQFKNVSFDFLSTVLSEFCVVMAAGR